MHISLSKEACLWYLVNPLAILCWDLIKPILEISFKRYTSRVTYMSSIMLIELVRDPLDILSYKDLLSVSKCSGTGLPSACSSEGRMK